MQREYISYFVGDQLKRSLFVSFFEKVEVRLVLLKGFDALNHVFATAAVLTKVLKLEIACC